MMDLRKERGGFGPPKGDRKTDPFPLHFVFLAGNQRSFLVIEGGEWYFTRLQVTQWLLQVEINKEALLEFREWLGLMWRKNNCCTENLWTSLDIVWAQELLGRWRMTDRFPVAALSEVAPDRRCQASTRSSLPGFCRFSWVFRGFSTVFLRSTFSFDTSSLFWIRIYQHLVAEPSLQPRPTWSP